MTARFRKKVAFVTGGSRGIGRATAVALGAGGAQVVIGFVQDEEAARSAAAEVATAGGGSSIVRLDVADADACKAAVERVVSDHGGLHILVNNAGVSADGLLPRLREEAWQRSLAVNLSGVLYLCRAAARSMMKQREGAIVNVTSVVAQSGNAGQAAYAAAKGGVISLTRSLARELAKRNIRVNAVAPGWIETDMTASVSPESREKALEAVPLGRAGTAREVANAIAFLASDEASYVTGHVLAVNGGIYM